MSVIIEIEAIKEWLEVTDSEKNFSKGIELLSKNSRNQCMINMVTRKRNLPLLIYQLGKVIGRPVISKQQTSIEVRELKVVAVKSSNTQPNVDLTDKIQEKFNKIDPSKLDESQKSIYDKITEAYKVQRTYHEKMKLATTDEQRGELRAMVIEADEIIAKGWDAIDSKKQTKTNTGEKSTLDISRDINAARSYITKNLNSLKSLPEAKKQKRIEEIKKRVDVLISSKAPVKSETFNALKNSGIISEQSGLVIETR